MTRMTPLRRAGVALLLAIALLTALTTSATAQSKRAAAQMNVFAAASLTEAFPKFDGGQKYNFAGTDALAAQIRLGAPADVFAGASPDAPQALFRAGLVEQPVTFATNKLVLAVPAANPANITSVYDLRRPGIKLIIGTATVPIGAYTRQVLGNLGSPASAMPNVVSQEQNVNAISRRSRSARPTPASCTSPTPARSPTRSRSSRFPSGRSRRCGTRSRSSRTRRTTPTPWPSSSG